MRRRRALWMRAKIIQAIRRFFVDRGYLEVETPHRIPAPAPETHIDAVPSGSWFLHPSPELCMKRLVASGYERIFQICRVWREGERGSQHTPEFTLLEWYRSGSDYRDLMEECETMIRNVASTIGLGETLSSRGHTLGLSAPWERISVSEAFRRHTRMPMEQALEADLFDELMVREIEPRLGAEKPTFLYDYPAERGALARLKNENPALAERFELYIGGVELANAFSELADAEEQRRRFIKEQAIRREMLKPVYPMPERFLEELGGMGPSAGAALGVDRLVMVLLDAPRIDDVVAFTPEEL
jgi:lysyl-tRNA synthetase class 2